MNDIYDLAWSPDGKYIITGSIDYKAQIWDVSTKTCVQVLKDHTHFVQGVAWDPLGEYLATQSSDRWEKTAYIPANPGILVANFFVANLP